MNIPPSGKLAIEDRILLHSKDYADSFETDQSPKRLSRLIPLLRINANAVLGDFGCGNSLLLEFLAGRRQDIATYYGIDFSSDLIEYAKKRSQKLGFSQASYFQGTIQDFCSDHPGALDLATVLDVSEHIYDDELLEILQAAYRSLKDGGALYLHTPNRDFFVELMKGKNFIFKQFPEHIAVRNSAENLSLIMKAGFSDVKIHYLPHYNILKYLHLLSWIPFVGKYFQARLFIVATKSPSFPN